MLCHGPPVTEARRLVSPDRAPDLSLGPHHRLGDHRFAGGRQVQIDGYLGPRTWLAIYGTVILAPLAIVALYVAVRAG
jgi:hypothetical protein